MKCYFSSNWGGEGGKGKGEGEGEVLLGVNDTDFNVWLTITKEQLFLLFSPTYNFVLFLGLQ